MPRCLIEKRQPGKVMARCLIEKCQPGKVVVGMDEVRNKNEIARPLLGKMGCEIIFEAVIATLYYRQCCIEMKDRRL